MYTVYMYNTLNDLMSAALVGGLELLQTRSQQLDMYMLLNIKIQVKII